MSNSDSSLPTVPFTDIGDGTKLPRLGGDYLVLIPTHDDDDKPQFYTATAFFHPESKQFWLDTSDVVIGEFPETEGKPQQAWTSHYCRRCVNVTHEVVAWAQIPNPSNFQSVVPVIN